MPAAEDPGVVTLPPPPRSPGLPVEQPTPASDPSGDDLQEPSGDSPDPASPPPSEGEESCPSGPANHSPGTARLVVPGRYDGLGVCGGHDAWFAIALQRGDNMLVTVEFEGAPPKLELWRGQTLLDRLDGPAGGPDAPRRVGVRGAPEHGAYHLRVASPPASEPTLYSLTVELGARCDDDELPDDAVLGVGRTEDLVLCAQGRGGKTEDTYRVDVGDVPGGRVVVRWDPAEGDLLGHLLGDSVLDAIHSGGRSAWIFGPTEGEPMRLRLRSAGANVGDVRYMVDVHPECTAEERAALCEEAPPLLLAPGPLAPNGQPEFFEAALQGTTCAADGAMGCFEPHCAEGAAPERIWRLDTTAPPFTGRRLVEVSLRRVVHGDWPTSVSFRTGCEDDAGESSCRLDPRRPYRETLLPGRHNLLIDGAGGECGPFDIDLTVREIDEGLNRCDSCVAHQGRPCRLGDEDDPALALATWRSVGGQAEDDYNFTLQLRDTTSLSNPNQFGGGVASCIDVANARFSPDTVYQFSTPEGAAEGCRFTARLAAENFVGGLSLRTACPAGDELACKFENNFAPKVLWVEELPPGEYTLWVKGSGALQSGQFTLDLQCTPPEGPWPGAGCEGAVRVALEPLVDRMGFELGSVAEAVVGQNIGASDTGDHGAACRSEPCDPDVGGDCGGDVWYAISQEQLASVWYAELEADYPATFTLYRGRCDGFHEVACGNNQHAIELFDLFPGDYLLVVDAEGAGARGGHQIDITSLEQGPQHPHNDACQGEFANPNIRAQEIAFEVGRRVQIDSSTFGANHDRNPLTCGDPAADAKDVVFVYTADEPHGLEARVFGGFDHNLYVRAEDCLEGEEVACAEGDLEYTVLPAGTYFIFVDGLTELQQGGFTLQVTFEAIRGECLQGDGSTCHSAQEIPLDDNLRADFVGRSSDCANSETPPDGCGQPGEEGVDSVYYFDLPVASHVDIIIDAPAFDEVAYLRRAEDGDGCALAPDLFCVDNDPARINPADPLPSGRYYLIVDAEFGDDRGGPIRILISTVPFEPMRGLNDTCDEVAIHHAELARHLAFPEAFDLALPEECLEDDDPQYLARCGLLDPLFEEWGERITVAGGTDGALPNYDVREHDPFDQTTCEEAGGLRQAGDANDVVYRFSVDWPARLEATLNNIDIGNAVLSLRSADAQGGCGGLEPELELRCADDPPELRVLRLDPGDYYLIVNGFDRDVAGRFTLDIELRDL